MKYKDRVQFIDKINEGVISTKNLGLEKAKGSWVIFLDADDYLDEKYIEKCLVLARQGSNDIIYTNMQLFGAKNEVFKAKPHSQKEIRKGNYIHNSALIRTDLVRSIGGYKHEMAGGYEDWELYLSMLERGAKAAWINEALLHYRQHSINSRNNLAQEKSEKLLQKAIELHPKIYGLNYHFEKKYNSASVWISPKKKYAKIFWPPTWVRRVVINSKRIKLLKKDIEKKNRLKKKITKATQHIKNGKIHSSLLEIKNTRKYYQGLDKEIKKKAKNGKDTH